MHTDILRKQTNGLRVFIAPSFNSPDKGEGGIRRVVEMQRKYLPNYGVEIVDSEAQADVVAMHAGEYITTRKPTVAHCHGLYWQEYKWADWARDLNKRVIEVVRTADAVTVPSNWVGYILQRGMNINTTTVYHGIEADEWEPGAKTTPFVLWNKTRVDPICDASVVDELAKRLPHIHFVTTYGTPAKNVTVTGRLPFDEAKKYIQESTIYLATPRETFGIGTLEAMASDSLIAGFNWGGQAEFIEHGRNGLLVAPGNIDALASEIDAILMDDVRRDLLIRAARLELTEFTCENAASEYARVYLSVASCATPVRTSVVITCYNLAETLPRAVSSVLEQDDKDVEIVIVDDASPDNTGEVVQKLQIQQSGECIRYIRNDENQYLAGALNTGIAAAQGRYIIPLDADNELAPGALKTLAEALDNDKSIDIAYGAMQVVEEKPGGRVYVSGWPGEFDYFQQMRHRNQIPSTSIYRKRIWERASGYRRRCRTAEDADFWCRVTSLGAVAKRVTRTPTLIYHDRADSMSHVESDWGWHDWYTWSRMASLTPFAAPVQHAVSGVPTFEPALVTVVIPVGPGHDKYIYDALDSLVAQTYQNWRVIVVDDRAEPMPMWLPSWVEVLRTGARNMHHSVGAAMARNIGIGNVETRFFLPLDADDYLQPEALEMMLSAWLERGKPENEYYYSDWFKQEAGKIYKAPDWNVEHFRTHLTHSVTALYPTAAWIKTEGFDAELDAWEDWDFVLKLIDAGYCGVHIAQPLFYYRYEAGQRREALYANREQHTENIKTKWRKYMVEKQPMACGCKGGKTTYSTPVKIGNDSVLISKAGETLIQFIGHSAPRTYRGPSGTEYRFGSDDAHKIHSVKNVDVPLFQNRNDFVLVNGGDINAVVLEAKGPPKRKVAVPA